MAGIGSTHIVQRGELASILEPPDSCTDRTLAGNKRNSDRHETFHSHSHAHSHADVSEAAWPAADHRQTTDRPSNPRHPPHPIPSIDPMPRPMPMPMPMPMLMPMPMPISRIAIAVAGQRPKPFSSLQPALLCSSRPAYSQLGHPALYTHETTCSKTYLAIAIMITLWPLVPAKFGSTPEASRHKR